MKNIERQLKNLGIEIKGVLSLVIDLDDTSKTYIYDMNIMTFNKVLVGVYYKKLDTVFSASSLGLN